MGIREESGIPIIKRGRERKGNIVNGTVATAELFPAKALVLNATKTNKLFAPICPYTLVLKQGVLPVLLLPLLSHLP